MSAPSSTSSATTKFSSHGNANAHANGVPVVVQPLHHPKEMAQIELPKGIENYPQGVSEMGGQALLAKKMAASGAQFYSPTDTLVSPCTKKLNLQKGKRWANVKGKPLAFGPSSLANVSNISTTTSPNPNSTVSSEGFLHPIHAVQAATQLKLQHDLQQTQRFQAQPSQTQDVDMSFRV